MLNKIIEFSVRQKLIIGLFVIGLIGFGSYEVTQLPIDAVPDITDNQVQVITVSPALGATDVERLITFPIEQSCSNIPGLKNIRSFSRFGLSLVTVVFKDNVDIYWARQQISERISQVKQTIPNSIGTPEMAPVTTGLGEIYQYVVRAKPGYEHRYNAMSLRTIQDWMIRRQLLGTPGVADVSSFGGQLKQYEIAVRTEQLKAYGVTIADIFQALEINNENTGGAYIEKGPTVLYIRTEGLTKGIPDIEKIVVKKLANGMPVLIRDVATVGLGYATRYGAMTYNDQGEVAGAVVMMLKGENSSSVIKNVKAKITEIQQSLPEGVIIEAFLDRTKMVNNAINTVKTNLIEGALIVVFVLVFFLGNLRAGLIVSSVIPLSMLFAIILMNQFGIGGNLMSLGAIDFGLIVDGSVIVVEAILHRFTHSAHFAKIGTLSQQEMNQEVEHSTVSMIKSAVFSQIIILIVYIPILSLEGIEGKMFKPMAFTVAFAILGAFILSVTYVPMMSSLFLSKKISHAKTLADKMMAWTERKYQPLLHKVIAFPKTAIAATLSMFAVSVFVLLNMGGEFIPELEEGDFAIDTRLLTGSSLTNTINTTQKSAKILLERFPEVEKVVTKIGSSEIPLDPMPLEASDMMVILKDKNKWVSASSFDELAAKMGKELEDIPGVSFGFQYPVQMRFNELMTGARQDVVCKIFGEDLDTLARYSKNLGEIISTVDGATNLYVETVTGMPQVVITYNREAMAMYGLNVRDINNTVNTAFAGQSAGLVYEGEKRFDLVVRLEDESRRNIKDIENLLIPLDNGNQVPLYQVANIEEIVGPNQIQRENTRRRIVVGFNVRGRDVQSIVTELQDKVSKNLNLPAGYTIRYGGAFENLNAAKARLSIVLPVALLLIFLMLYFAFGSIKQGLLIYTAIPLSA
nr:CusA/CzcA family heavy metal efflux RND transporter [Cyclobacteriaceae bacterium]